MENRFFFLRAFLAQLVEHPPCKRKVLGSIPRGGTLLLFAYFFSLFYLDISLLLRMEYKVNFYEALTRRMYVSWLIVLDKSFSEKSIQLALEHVYSKHPYLRCTIREGASLEDMVLVDSKSLHPVLAYSTEEFDMESLHDRFEHIVRDFSNDLKCTDTAHFTAIADVLHSSTAIIGCFCHSCADALSSIRVAVDFLHYLDCPLESLPPSREFVSVQNEIILKPQEPGHIRFPNLKGEIWSAPIRLHEDSASCPSYFRTKRVLIPMDRLNLILAGCREHGCSFQCYLWACMALCQMALFRKQFPLTIRFGTPATTVGRAEFRRPITKEDLVVGAYTIFVESRFESQRVFWDLCREMMGQLREAITKGDQMNDFFAICRAKDFSLIPPASLNGCTLGVTELQATYNNFALKEFFFLPTVLRQPGMGGLNLHSMTIPGIGCYLHCTYCYPAFSPEDMDGYAANLDALFDAALEENKTLQQLLEKIEKS